MADGYEYALCERVRAEAIKEFAERLKLSFCPDCEYIGYDIREAIDNLAKETVGEKIMLWITIIIVTMVVCECISDFKRNGR